MTSTRCEHCGKVSTAGFVCPSCTGQLLDVLKDVPEMIDQLRITLSRQSKFGGSGGKSTGETPIVFHPKASDVSVEYAKRLLRWQGRLADHLDPPRTPANTRPPYRISQPVRFLNPIAAASWMHTQITEHGIGHWADSPTMVRRLIEIDDTVEEIIDRPATREFLGDCEFTDEGEACAGRVYAAREDVYGECNICHGRCDAQEQRLKLLVWMDARYLTAAEIARMATYLGLTINREQVRKRINQWHHRGRITAGHDVNDVTTELDPEQETEEGPAPTFLFSEVRRMLEAEEEERQRRKRAG